MDYQELIDSAFIQWIEKNYAYMLFTEILKIKWRRICILQGGAI